MLYGTNIHHLYGWGIKSRIGIQHTADYIHCELNFTVSGSNNNNNNNNNNYDDDDDDEKAVQRAKASRKAVTFSILLTLFVWKSHINMYVKC